MDVDIVTQPLVESDLNSVLHRICAGGVGIVKSVTSTQKSSSVFHLPLGLLLSFEISFEVKLITIMIKFQPNTANKIRKGREGTLPLEDLVGL